MATWKYEISLLILKNISLVRCTHLLQYVTIATVKRTFYFHMPRLSCFQSSPGISPGLYNKVHLLCCTLI